MDAKTIGEKIGVALLLVFTMCAAAIMVAGTVWAVSRIL